MVKKMSEELLHWHAPCGIYCKRCMASVRLGCEGCREREGKVLNGPLCKTYECITEKGHEFCYECDDFPCEMLEPIVHFEQFTPHNSKVYNLVMIQKLGLEEWNKICEEKSTLYYKGKKIGRGGDPLTLEKEDSK